MNDYEFTRALLAAIRVRRPLITVDSDVHQDRFQLALESLADDRPRGLVPNPFSGRYPQWDNVILAYSDFVTVLQIRGSADSAQARLNRLSEANRELVERAASVYLEHTIEGTDPNDRDRLRSEVERLEAQRDQWAVDADQEMDRLRAAIVEHACACGCPSLSAPEHRDDCPAREYLP